MTPSKACFDLIKRFEGLRLTAYPDPGSGGDPWTVGFGATGPGIRKGTTWTQAQANERLVHDVTLFGERVLTALAGAPTAQNEFDSLVSLSYNIGFRSFLNSTLLRDHIAGHRGLAAAEFGRWVTASGRRMAGLVHRREAEAKLYKGEA